MSNEAAIMFLYENIHALPDPEYGTINFLPFAHDSEQVRMVRRQMSEAIVRLLDSNGFMAKAAPAAKPPVRRNANVKCHACGALLVGARVGDDGVGRVDARAFISGIARLNPECPHAPLTFEDHRRYMQQKAQEQLDEAAKA